MTNSPDLNKSVSIVNAEDDLYYFESDHLAVRGNKDYSELLKTLFVLTAQREQAIKDYDKVVQIKKKILNEPEKTLEYLKNDDHLDLPPLHRVPGIPDINWSKYDTRIGRDQIEAIYNDKILHKKEDNKDEILKLQDKNYSVTHKQPWSAEEQRRLEELLVVYPPEPIELRRVKKIAAALGTRTSQQVSSRLQKYFLKLCKAGMYVPGKIPKAGERIRRGTGKHKHQKHNHLLFKPTTFFPEYNVSVFMDDNDQVPGPSSQEYSLRKEEPEGESSQNYLLPGGYHNKANEPNREKSESELQLELLKRIKMEKVRECSGEKEPFQHLTYRCDYCNEEPILATRWHCSTCSHDSVDFCTDCLLAQMYSDNCHPLSHIFVTFPDSESTSNMSSDSEDGSGGEENCTADDNELEENSDLNYDSDTIQSYLYSKSLQGNSSDDNVCFENGKSIKKERRSPDFEVSHVLTNAMFETKPMIDNSTLDVSYNYLHSNLYMEDT